MDTHEQHFLLTQPQECIGGIQARNEHPPKSAEKEVMEMAFFRHTIYLPEHYSRTVSHMELGGSEQESKKETRW